MKFRPLHDRVVVKRIEAEDKSRGGIIIPDTAKEKPSQGEVVAVGPGGRDEAGKLIPIDIKVGDRVLFGKWSGTEVTSTASNTDHERKRHHGRVGRHRGQGRPRERRFPASLSGAPNGLEVGSTWVGRGVSPGHGRTNHFQERKHGSQGRQILNRRARQDVARHRHSRQCGEGHAGAQGPQRGAG